jgi:2-methylcitrate dehydratase PrpD
VLAGFALAARPSERPALRTVAARHLLDALGCGLAAVAVGEGGHATAVVRAAGGRGESSVLGEATRLPAAAAAFANGTRCHALDFDDTHEAGICHASAVVGPAALALAEAGGHPWGDLVDAYLVGVETALRIAVACAPSIYRRGFHPTSVCGAFGAAAAAARLGGLDQAAAADALGVVGSFASGLMEYLGDGSATKPLHAGWAAQAGVQAAALAAAGASGPAGVLEGRFGLFASHGDDEPDLGAITADLGTSWEAERLAIKPYPACHFLHAATWAVAELAGRHGFGAADVAGVEVEVAAEGVPLVLDPLAAKHRPATPYDAKFSAPWAIAHHLLHGELNLASFAPERIVDPATLALAARVGGGAWREGAPPSKFAAAVTVTTTAGAELREVVPHTPGSPDNPLSEGAVRAKFCANAGLALPTADVEALVAGLGAARGRWVATEARSPPRLAVADRPRPGGFRDLSRGRRQRTSGPPEERPRWRNRPKPTAAQPPRKARRRGRRTKPRTPAKRPNRPPRARPKRPRAPASQRPKP